MLILSIDRIYPSFVSSFLNEGPTFNKYNQSGF